MAIWTAEIKQLERLYESFKGQFPKLEIELEQLVKFDDPNVLMLYSRRCLEVIIIDLCECELKRPRKTEPLTGIIDKLNREEKVPSHIITSMHSLNNLSTYGTHPKDFDPEQVKPVLINLDIILKWYLKYKGFQVVFRSDQEVQTIGIKPEKEKRSALTKKSLNLRPLILVSIIILMALLFLLYRHSRIKWAKEVALTEIEQLINKANIADAIKLVQKAGKYISKEPKFQELSTFVTSKLTIQTDPPGADVCIKEYSDTDGKWRKIGRTPIESAKIPGSSFWQASSIYRLKIVKSGYETIFTVISTTADSLHRKLFKQG